MGYLLMNASGLLILRLAVGTKFIRKKNFLASTKFSHTSQLIKIKTDFVLKQFKMNIYKLISSKIFLSKGK